MWLYRACGSPYVGHLCPTLRAGFVGHQCTTYGLSGCLWSCKRHPRQPETALSADAPVSGGLSCLPQAGVAAVLGDECRVVALLNQTPAVENEDLVGVADGGEAVGNHQHGFVLHQGGEGAHEQGFVFGVGKGGGFV